MLSIPTVQLVGIIPGNADRDAHSLSLLPRSYFALCSCVRQVEGHVRTYSDVSLLANMAANHILRLTWWILTVPGKFGIFVKLLLLLTAVRHYFTLAVLLENRESFSSVLSSVIERM
jgi:hypothetical protein